MDSINIEETFSSALTNIWNKHKDVDTELIGRGFCVPRQVNKNSLLFLGANPSYTKEDRRNVFYDAGSDIQYFKRMNELINGDYEKSFGVNWTHFDLLFLKETDQKKIDSLIKVPAGKSFINDQLELSKKILELSKPKIIFASNAKVRHFLGYGKHGSTGLWMGYIFEFDNEIGTPRIKTEGVLYNTPIFFTSMLSGPGTLDIGSFQRLSWHIRFVLGKM